MTYQYKMVQVPQVIEVKSKEYHGGEAAAYLEQIVNRHAKQGWEFYRVDTIGELIEPGCFASLFGKKAEVFQYYVVTFRKEK